MSRRIRHVRARPGEWLKIHRRRGFSDASESFLGGLAVFFIILMLLGSCCVVLRGPAVPQGMPGMQPALPEPGWEGSPELCSSLVRAPAGVPRQEHKLRAWRTME